MVLNISIRHSLLLDKYQIFSVDFASDYPESTSTHMSVMCLLLVGGWELPGEAHNGLRVLDRNKKKMWNIYKRTVPQGSAHSVLRRNRKTWSHPGNLRQPICPFPECLFCVFKPHLKDACVTATLQCEGLKFSTMGRKEFPTLKSKIRQTGQMEHRGEKWSPEGHLEDHWHAVWNPAPRLLFLFTVLSHSHREENAICI